MLSKKIVAIGMAILNIIIACLTILKLRTLIGMIWSHQGDNRWLIAGSIVLLSIGIVGAVFNLLILGLMPWLRHYQHLKIVEIVTAGVLVVSVLGLII